MELGKPGSRLCTGVEGPKRLAERLQLPLAPKPPQSPQRCLMELLPGCRGRRLLETLDEGEG